MSGAVGMTPSVVPPVVRHRQQALDLVTGVRQGLQKVHQTCLMRTSRRDRPGLHRGSARFRAPRSCKVRFTLFTLMPYRSASAAAVAPAMYCSAMRSRSPASNRLSSHLGDGGTDCTANGPLWSPAWTRRSRLTSGVTKP